MKNLLKDNKFGPVTLAVLAAISLSLPVTSYAQGDERTVVRINIEGQAKIPEWRVSSYNHSDWQNHSVPFNCSSWDPMPADINWGETYQQYRDCSQKQVRVTTPILENPILGTFKEAEPFQQEQNIIVTQAQWAVGERDFIAGERADEWSQWQELGSLYDCSNWTPDADNVNLFQQFTQDQTCSQDQQRSRTIFNSWASGKETELRVEQEEQTIQVTSSRTASGTKDYIDGERIGNWSSWANVGTAYNCDGWSPATSTVNEGVSFTQSRSCSQDQSSERDIYDVWRSGNEEYTRSESRNRIATTTESRQRTGTKEVDRIVDSYYQTKWVYISSADCGAWELWTANGGRDFRACYIDRNQQRRLVRKWSSGRTTYGSYSTIKTEIDAYRFDYRFHDDGRIDYGTWQSPRIL